MSVPVTIENLRLEIENWKIQEKGYWPRGYFGFWREGQFEI